MILKKEFPSKDLNIQVLVVMQDIIVGISRLLQERSLDIGRALKSVTLVQSSLEDYRANIEQYNHQCFERSAKICEPLDIELKVKKIRICGRQIMRYNVQIEGPEDYFRKNTSKMLN
jgi:hypothetical protein